MRGNKTRRISLQPPCTRFRAEGADDGNDTVVGLDMLEAMRLVDDLGLPQSAAAAQMGVSTPTLCRILGEGRRRTAQALVNGRNIVLEGGNIMYTSDTQEGQHQHRHGQGCGMGRGQGRGCGQGMGQGRGQGMGQGRGQGCGQGMGQGRGQGHGQGMGQGRGMGRGQGMGQGRGMGRGQGCGTEAAGEQPNACGGQEPGRN